MRTRRAMVVLLVVGLIAAGVARSFRGEPQSRLVLATNFVDTGTVAVRVDRFEQVWELPGTVSRVPPNWGVRYPVLLNGWRSLFREQVPQDLAWYVVEVAAVSDQPLDDLHSGLITGHTPSGRRE